MLKYPHLQKDITSLNLNVPNKVASKFIKQKLTKPKQETILLLYRISNCCPQLLMCPVQQQQQKQTLNI